jgi:hypothetical protein
MSRETYCEGTATYSSTGKTTIHAFDGDVTFTAATKNRWSGKENGIIEHDYVAPEKKKEEKKKTAEESVKEIELLTALDDGSANDKSGKLQKGMIFGKAYQFKVKSYAKDTPKDKSVIKWTLKYHSLSKNKWVEIPLPLKGDTVKITMNEEDMCGRFVYIRAYINDSEKEGELKVWKHNRFRWFDRMIVEEEIKDRTDNKKPWLVNQAGTSLCGMACIFYLFAKEQPKEYAKFAKTLFRTGEATFNKYTAKPSEDLFNKETKTQKVKEKNITSVKGTSGMPLVDYLTMAGTRNTDNKSYKGGNEEFEAINWPPLMTELSGKLLGYKEVSSKGVYNPVKPLAYTDYDIKAKIDDVNKQIKNGYSLILMIDADLINDVWDMGSLDLHWVVLESEIKEVEMLDENGRAVHRLDFRVYSWGTNPNNDTALILNTKTGKMEENVEYRYLKRPITKTHFMNNYNGYIKIK